MRLNKKRKVLKCACGNKFRPKARQQFYCSATCSRIYAPARLKDVEVRANRTKVPWTVIYDPCENGYDTGAILYDVDLVLEFGEFTLGTVLTRMGKVCVVVRPDEDNCRQALIDVSAVISQSFVRNNPKHVSESIKNEHKTYSRHKFATQESTWFFENSSRS